jgi:hypothetical protein
MYKFQVNFEKAFTEGVLKGKVYHDHLRFVLKSDAVHFSKRDGMIVVPFGGSEYMQRNSQVIDLAKFA